MADDNRREDEPQSQSCIACLNQCLIAAEAAENEEETEGTSPMTQNLVNCFGAVKRCCFHVDARRGDEEEDGNNLLEDEPNVAEGPHCGVLCSCWDAFKTWFSCLNEGQGSTLLSLHYFLLVMAASVGLTFAHTSSHGESGLDENCDVTARQTHLEGFIAFLIFVSLVGFVVCVCCHGHCRGECCPSRSNQPDYMLIGTVIFGLFSTIWFILRWFAQETCKSGRSKVDTMYSVVGVIFIMSEVYFLYAHSNIKFTKSCPMEMFLMHVVVTNFCVWFRITVGEAVDRERELPIVCGETVFDHKCINNSYFKNSNISTKTQNATLLEHAMPFLYPCIAEFCLSASGLLFKMWMFPATNLGNQGCTEAQAGCLSRCGCQCDVSEDPPQNHAVRTPRLNRLLLSAPIFAALLASLSVVCIVLNVVYKDVWLAIPFLYDVSQLVTILVALLAAIVGISSFAETKRDPGIVIPEDEQPANEHPVPESEHARELVVESALLMISLAGLSVAQGLELAASLDTVYVNHALNHSSNQTGMCWHMLRTERATGFLTVLMSFLQTVFIIRSLKAKSSREGGTQQESERGATGGDEARRISRSCYSLYLRHLAARVLLICNLTLWLTKTYELSGLYCNPLYYHFYGPWIQLSDVFYPLWIFFHFHSAASCFDIVC